MGGSVVISDKVQCTRKWGPWWARYWQRDTSAKSTFLSINVFSLLYPQTQWNEIDVELEIGIALVFGSVVWVVAIMLTCIITTVPTFANVKTSTWWIIHTSFCNIMNHVSIHFYITQFDVSWCWWKFSLCTLMKHAFVVVKDCPGWPGSMVVILQKWFTICILLMQDTPEPHSCLSVVGGLPLSTITISQGWDHT